MEVTLSLPLAPTLTPTPTLTLTLTLALTLAELPKQIQFCEHDVIIVVGHSHFFRTMFQVSKLVLLSCSK